MTLLDAALLDEDAIAGIREVLPAVQEVAYLNAGTLGPLPMAAIEAMATEREYDEHVRQDERHWERLAAAQERARTAVGSLTGVDGGRVALMHATHPGLNACAWGMGLQRDDSVVTTDEEHPGLLVPLRHVRDRLGCHVRTAHWHDDDDEFVAEIAGLVDAGTRAVALSHVSWVSGRVVPLRALRDALPEDVRIVVDGAQSAGVLATDPSDGWDAYTVSGQKWPCGPNGTGGVALADPGAWAATFGAFMQVSNLDDIVGSPLVPDGRRLEFAQEAIVPLVGFAAAVEWLTGSVGLDRIRAHARALNARMRAALADAGIASDRMQGRDHLLVVDSPAARAVEAAGTLYRQGVLVRYLSPTRLRVSFGCWNTPDEVDALSAALPALLA